MKIKCSEKLARIIRAFDANPHCSDRNLPDSLARARDAALKAEAKNEFNVDLGARVGIVPPEFAGNPEAAALFELGFRKSVALNRAPNVTIITQ